MPNISDAPLHRLARDIGDLFIKVRASGSDTQRVLAPVLAVYFTYVGANDTGIAGSPISGI